MSLALTLLLLEHKASLEVRDQTGNTSLHWAAATGKRDVIKCMLALRPDLVDVRGEMGETALHLAARFGHELVCLLLLEAGGGLLRNTLGMSPLDLAGAKEDFLTFPSASRRPAGRPPPKAPETLKSLHTVGLFCPYSRSLLTLVLPKAPESVMMRRRVRKCIMVRMSAGLFCPYSRSLLTLVLPKAPDTCPQVHHGAHECRSLLLDNRSLLPV